MPTLMSTRKDVVVYYMHSLVLVYLLQRRTLISRLGLLGEAYQAPFFGVFLPDEIQLVVVVRIVGQCSKAVGGRTPGRDPLALGSQSSEAAPGMIATDCAPEEMVKLYPV